MLRPSFTFPGAVYGNLRQRQLFRAAQRAKETSAKTEGAGVMKGMYRV
jgi:hypothetical protein